MSGSFHLRALAIHSAFVSAVLVSGCDTTLHYAGLPPANAVLAVREVRIDTVYDTLDRRGVRLSIESKWAIDAGEFGVRPYRYGIVLGIPSDWSHPKSKWTPVPMSRRIANAVDSLRDTLWCVADTCHWPSPTVHVMADLGDGHFLSVASAWIMSNGRAYP